MKNVTFCKLLKTSRSRNFVYIIYKRFRDFVKCMFMILLQVHHMKIIFYLPVNNGKPKFVTFLVFVCTTSSFLTQISSFENVWKQGAILALVAKQWIGNDIPSYGSQSNLMKIAIHWFGKY